MNKKIKIIFVIFGIVIVALAASLIAVLLNNKRNTVTSESEKRTTVVNEENVQEIVQDVVENPASVTPAYFTVNMSNIWNYESGDATSEDAYVGNLEENSNDVYFDVVLANDEQKIIYSSPVIPRGGELKDIKLDEPLQKGQYECVLIYHLIDDEQNTVGTLRVGIEIVVNN